MILCARPSPTAVCHYSYYISDRCPRLSASHLCFDAIQCSFLPPLLLPRLLLLLLSVFITSASPLCLHRGGAPRLGQHQRVPLLADLWRGLGHRTALQLALRESGHHQRRGDRLHGWDHAVCDQDAVLWPLHLHGQQQAGRQRGHLHSRYARSLAPMSMEALVTFSSPRDRSRVSQMEKIPTDPYGCHTTRLCIAGVASSKCLGDSAVQFDSKHFLGAKISNQWEATGCSYLAKLAIKTLIGLNVRNRRFV